MAVEKAAEPEGASEGPSAPSTAKARAPAAKLAAKGLRPAWRKGGAGQGSRSQEKDCESRRGWRERRLEGHQLGVAGEEALLGL